MTAVVPALTENVDASAEAVSDGVAFTRIAREFHDLVVAFTPNDTIRYVVRSLVALWSAQEQQWAAALTKRGEYPSVAEARGAVRTHRRMVDEIAAGRADEARTHRPPAPRRHAGAGARTVHRRRRERHARPELAGQTGALMCCHNSSAASGPARYPGRSRMRRVT